MARLSVATLSSSPLSVSRPQRLWPLNQWFAGPLSQASPTINRTPCVTNRAQWCRHCEHLFITPPPLFFLSRFLPLSVSVCPVLSLPCCSRSSLSHMLFSQWLWFLAARVKNPQRSALFLCYSALWAGWWHLPMDLQSISQLEGKPSRFLQAGVGGMFWHRLLKKKT